jgi:uncharacterized protein (DUF433 family)
MKMKAMKEDKNVIRGSKVPIKYLLDYIKDGYGISDFLASYPWLKRKDVENAIDEIKKRDFTASYGL